MLLEAAEQPPPQRWPGFLRTPPPREEWGEEKRVEAGGGPAEGHGHGREGGGGGGGNGEGPCR